MEDRTCQHCDGVYTANHPRKRYCSKRCQEDAWRLRRQDHYRHRAVELGATSCEMCGTLFPAPKRGRRWCSASCTQKAVRQRRTDGVEFRVLACEECGVPIERPRLRFCSKQCGKASRRRDYSVRRDALSLPCEMCGEAFDRTHGNQKYCSKACSTQVTVIQSYGLTPTEYRAMRDSQDHRCAICGTAEPSVMNPSAVRDGWHIDHCHDTGKVRGILCPPCNLMIGYARDNVDTLRRAIDYLT